MKKFKFILSLILIIFLNIGFSIAQEEIEEFIEEEVEGLELIQNGNFNELTPWEIILINIKETNYYEAQIYVDYFMWVRKNSEADGGFVGIKQSLGNFDLRDKKSLKLSFDILISFQELDSDGWAGGEYPAQVILIFENENNEEYVYKKCFILKGSTINYPENNVTEIESGDFYHFEADLIEEDIYNNIVSHPYLKEIIIGGSGWDFVGAVDNVSLIVK